ncbi:MAG: hypothetical protein N3B11_04735 [Coriobacteriia bacterium]|nr:hypothetical protein [Coriobacteriia bacterium]
MGRYRAIRQYRPSERPGQPLDLFSGKATRSDMVEELLKSPWIIRGSQAVRGALGAGKRREEPVDVVWDGAKRAPVAFERNGRRYRVEALVQTWSVERAWWDPRTRTSRRCFRVFARGGLYDLAFDLTEDRWLLIGIVD